MGWTPRVRTQLRLVASNKRPSRWQFAKHRSGRRQWGSTRTRWFGPRLGITLALLLAAMAFVAGGSRESVSLHPRTGLPTATTQPSEVKGLAYVRDGDTLEVSGVPVRLQGLHCPETDEPGGHAATQAMTRLTRAQTVSCTLTGERTYDRIVGTCYVDDTDLTAALIHEGVCARCPRYDPWMRYLPAQLGAGRWEGSMPGYCS